MPAMISSSVSIIEDFLANLEPKDTTNEIFY